MMLVVYECGAIGEMLDRAAEVAGENLSHCSFVHHKSQMTLLVLEFGPPRWEAGD
jgi:hypothetical protein